MLQFLMAKRSLNDQYSEQETRRRVEAALRGARIAGHKTMNDIPKKNGESRRVKPKKSKTRK
jgi:hypothetical protein